jgi:hypothetical protein
MAGIRMVPIAAVVAALEPEMAAKNIAEITVTRPRPPRARPTRAWAKLMRRPEMPAASMTAPARTKNGMAASGKESRPANMRWTSACSGIPELCMKTTAVMPSAIAIGTPTENRRISTTAIRAGDMTVTP